MARNRLQPFGTSNRTVRVDPNATDGATLGVNLYDQDGNLVDLSAMIADAIAAANDADDGISLDDVQAQGDGLVDVDGSMAQGYLSVGVDLARSWVLA